MKKFFAALGGKLKSVFSGAKASLSIRPFNPHLIVLHQATASVNVKTGKRNILQKVTVHKLPVGTFRVGRGKEETEVPVHLRLADNEGNKAIAPVHFVFETDAQGRCWLKDAGTKEGTKVDGLQKNSATLRDKNIISSAADEGVPNVAIIFDQYGDLSQTLGNLDEFTTYLASKLVQKGKPEK